MKIKLSKYILLACSMVSSVGFSADYGIQCSTQSYDWGYYNALVGVAGGMQFGELTPLEMAPWKKVCLI